MLYEVLVHASGGERFTIEPDTPLADDDTFEEDSESYRVLAIQPGHGPFAGVIEAEQVKQVRSGGERLAKRCRRRGARRAWQRTIDKEGFQAFSMLSMRSASRWNERCAAFNPMSK